MTGGDRLDPFQAVKAAVGRLIRDERTRRGWSQTKLGQFAGADQTSISEWERGVSLPKSQSLSSVAAALELPMERFRGEMTAAVKGTDEVEKAILRQNVLSTESQQALIAVYRRVLAADAEKLI